MRGLRALVLVLVGGCAADKAPEDTGQAAHTGDPAHTGDSADDEAPDPASLDLCERVLAGPGSLEDPVLALSAAHASVRLFGTSEDFLTPDQALVHAIEVGGLETPDLAGYAAALDLCLLPEADPLGAAQVRAVGGLAWVNPGAGEVSLPEGSVGVVIDLRGLPADPALAEALSAAVAPALATEVSGQREQLRRWSGFADQLFSRSNVYRTTVVKRSRDTLPATGGEDLPLVLVTDSRLAPEAAAYAATLASAGRAWICFTPAGASRETTAVWPTPFPLRFAPRTLKVCSKARICPPGALHRRSRATAPAPSCPGALPSAKILRPRPAPRPPSRPV